MSASPRFTSTGIAPLGRLLAGDVSAQTDTAVYLGYEDRLYQVARR